MTINKIDPNLNPQKIMNDRTREATSGKKTNIHHLDKIKAREASRTNNDNMDFSDDAKKLQETEVILRNALQKLHEMDEVNSESLSSFRDKLNSDFYSDNEEVDIGIADLIIPEEQMRRNISLRFKAEEYVDDIKEYDFEEPEIDSTKIEQIKAKIANGFYNQENIIANIAENILADMI